MKLSAIAKPQVGLGCFATQAFAEGDLVRFFNATMVYNMVLDSLMAGGVDGEGMMAATRKHFDD